MRRVAAHRGDDRDQRDDRQVLEQQDREGALAERGAQPPGRLQHRQHLRGRRQRQRQAERQRRRQREAGEQQRSRRSAPARTAATCSSPSPKMSRFIRHSRAGFELEPDDEQQQHDAELGDAELRPRRRRPARAPAARPPRRRPDSPASRRARAGGTAARSRARSRAAATPSRRKCEAVSCSIKAPSGRRSPRRAWPGP